MTKELSADTYSSVRPFKKVARNLEIAQMFLQGCTQKDLGYIFGISQARVSQILQDDEAVRLFVETASRKMVTLLPKVLKNYEAMLDDGENPWIQLNATRDIAKNTGVAPTASTSIVVNNIMNTNNLVADAETLRILREALQPTHIIDITPEGGKEE
jgi:hypothetical protein